MKISVKKINTNKTQKKKKKKIISHANLKKRKIFPQRSFKAEFKILYSVTVMFNRKYSNTFIKLVNKNKDNK